ncbi:hypothetical protein OS493_024009 [Desmophyllum pertusum]|uniref:Ig-like domain-containing protein n=1 Tax=Desmophyllum pertusum TaxID=174260 RepID=A0A9X0A015_9CNID|nr:hypothetical protein OS493_024009 [Desmophyllum pertusum]
MLTRILCHIVLFIHLANTGVTGLYLKPKCQVQAFSCPCDQSGGDGTEDLKKVSVTRCVTEGNLSKDVVCRSGDVVTKCHEMRVKRANEPFIESFGLQENDTAYIGSQINLTCKISNAEAAIFVKSGAAIREGGRFKYIFEHFESNRLVGSLEITNVTKDDGGVYTCIAYKNGVLASSTYTLSTGTAVHTKRAILHNLFS